MNRININLLPAEILEKRKAEKIIRLLVMGIAAVFVVAFLGYAYLWMLVDNETNKLDNLRAENLLYEREISKIADFEGDKTLVESREALVEKVIAKKFGWSKWLNNISLVIPNEVWLDTLQVSDKGEVELKGSTRLDKTNPDVETRPVAKWLVRLAEINDLSDIWLEYTKKSDSDTWNFNIKAVLTPLSESSDGSAPSKQGGT